MMKKHCKRHHLCYDDDVSIQNKDAVNEDDMQLTVPRKVIEKVRACEFLTKSFECHVFDGVVLQKSHGT